MQLAGQYTVSLLTSHCTDTCTHTHTHTHTQVLGVIDVAIGIWLIVEADSYDDASSITGENITAGGVTLLVSGVITIALCTTAIVGAVFKLRPLLIIVSLSLLLLCVLSATTCESVCLRVCVVCVCVCACVRLTECIPVPST